MMFDDAYSDFTYIIGHCAQKREAFYERLFLNFEISNFYEAIIDANMILSWNEDDFEVKRIKFLSLVYSQQSDLAKEFILNLFEFHKYKTIQFLFNEVALVLAKDEYSKGLKLLDLIDEIDKDNPIKLLKEANIYGLAGDKVKQDEIIKRIESIFPKYFVSHFRFSDMYQDKDLLEIKQIGNCQIVTAMEFDIYASSIGHNTMLHEGLDEFYNIVIGNSSTIK